MVHMNKATTTDTKMIKKQSFVYHHCLEEFLGLYHHRNIFSSPIIELDAMIKYISIKSIEIKSDKEMMYTINDKYTQKINNPNIQFITVTWTEQHKMLYKETYFFSFFFYVWFLFIANMISSRNLKQVTTLYVFTNPSERARFEKVNLLSRV